MWQKIFKGHKMHSCILATTAHKWVQKANYAVKMYKDVGFKTVNENAEEYIMVCEL